MINVIIVEDDPMVMKINRQYLKKIPGVHVAACFRNGADTLKYLQRHEADLILIDMFMPELNGIELLRRIRNAGISADVIIVTADNSIRNVKEAMSLGIIDYLIKPFEFSRFKAAVEKSIAKRALTEQEKNGSTTISQKEIDRLMQGETSNVPQPQICLDKGIQAKTLELLIRCLSSASDESVDCEALAQASGLSKVTVRRYMNYLIEKDQAESFTDYRTGGRPAIRYRIKR